MSEKEKDGFDVSIYITSPCTPEQVEENRRRYREQRIAIGACPECLQLEKDWKIPVKNVDSETKTESEKLVEVIIDSLCMGVFIGRCKSCGAPRYRDVL